jgi:trimeric autotransporter adhesin
MKSGFRSLALVAALTLLCSSAIAQRTLSYQGVVQDKSGNYLEGAHSVTVKLYSGNDTTSFWEETQHPNFAHGLFSIVIGSLRKLPALAIETPGIDHYMLGVTIDDGAEMTPRTMLTDAPAAFFADTAAFARAVDPSSLNFLSSINGIKSSPTIVGKGATSVTTRNDSIIINSSVQTPDIIQGVMNRDGSIDIKNGAGPVPEISVGPLGVTTANLARASVTTDRIATNAITTDRIASNAVTNDKIGSGSATLGFVLSADGTGGTVWQSPVAAALSLPFASTVSSSSNLFAITNSGSGGALAGTSTMNAVLGTTTTAAGVGVLGTTADGGSGAIANSGINGTTQGGNAVAGITTTGNAVYGVTNTTGVSVHGVTSASATTARAALFENLGNTTTGNVLESKALGTGSAGLFQINNTGNTSPALDVSTNGNGRAGRFQITNASSTAAAVEANTSSATGLALLATSATSASTNGTALVQNTGAAGFALEGDHTGSGTGVMGMAEGTGSTSRGVFGWASNTTGSGIGVYGQSEGQGTMGVYGLSNNAAGSGIGVYGQTNGAGGSAAGLYGWASNTSGAGYGVWGQTEATGSQAIVGKANATTGSGVGVYGWSRGSTGVGVYGQTDGTASNAYGVFGTVGSSTTTAALGVYGLTSGVAAGVYGQNNNSTAASGSGLLSGVFGTSNNASGFGVQGQNTASAGTAVLGLTSGTGVAILAQNNGTGTGLRGTVGSTTGILTFTPCGVTGIGTLGVQGITSSTAYGVYGSANGNSGRGVYGTALSPGGAAGSGTGVFAEASSTGNALIAQYIGTSTSTTTQANIAIFKSGTSPVNVARIDKNGVGYFNGGTQNSGADVAEALIPVGAKSEYEPGDVLVLSAIEATHVEKSSKAYSNCVAGVYATKAGVTLTTENVDADLSGHVPMGVIGILPTKVTTENGPIEVGDLLVTSSTPGYAMKGDDSKLRFGNILGKAMEPLKNGKSVIKVLVGKY